MGYAEPKVLNKLFLWINFLAIFRVRTSNEGSVLEGQFNKMSNVQFECVLNRIPPNDDLSGVGLHGFTKSRSTFYLSNTHHNYNQFNYWQRRKQYGYAFFNFDMLQIDASMIWRCLQLNFGGCILVYSSWPQDVSSVTKPKAAQGSWPSPSCLCPVRLQQRYSIYFSPLLTSLSQAQLRLSLSNVHHLSTHQNLTAHIVVS